MYSTSVSFFMGANTPEGFYSLFDGLYSAAEGWRAFVIKGGPGTGKSTLMKRIAAEADARGLFCERIHCSSDPNSLDAVILPGLKIAVADGTPPHAIEPRYPGVCEKIVDLGACRDDAVLRADAEKIIESRMSTAAAASSAQSGREGGCSVSIIPFRAPARIPHPPGLCLPRWRRLSSGMS